MTDLNTLKARGIIAQKQEGYFALRFLSNAGYFTAEEMMNLTEVARKYGNGELGLTSRLTLEIPYIKAEQLEAVLAFCEEKNLKIGGGGTSVRAILTCKGTVCKHGLADTNRITRAMDKQFFGRLLPGKFKISVLGCPNSYGKAQGNDLAFLAVREVKLDEEACIHCKKCVKVCPDGAFEIGESTLALRDEKCSRCGKCMPVCPVDALRSDNIEFLVFLGGRLGRKARLATPCKCKIQAEEINAVTEKVLAFYSEHAGSKERFAEVIERIGLETVEQAIFG
ncbi:MAG: 4Fe-4S binding protein [Niameybacter sp.]